MTNFSVQMLIIAIDYCKMKIKNTLILYSFFAWCSSCCYMYILTIVLLAYSDFVMKVLQNG